MTVGNNSMTCVCAPVESCTDIIIFRQYVNKLSFSFVTPLRAEYYSEF